jgi:type II secretory pathway pseudopilin PulG
MARSTTTRSSAGFGFTRFGARLRRRGDEDAGFTLAESIVSFTLFLILVTSATWWLVKTVQLSTANRDKIAAANLATQEIERLRGEASGTKQLDPSAHTVTLHNVVYTVTPVLTPTLAAGCATGTSRQISVSVSWAEAAPIRYDSVLAC